MEYFKIISELLIIGLNMWDRKDKEKHLKELVLLEKRRQIEEAKPLRRRDQAMLDCIDRELLLLSEQFISATKDGR